jgi:hypothetical protein
VLPEQPVRVTPVIDPFRSRHLMPTKVDVDAEARSDMGPATVPTEAISVAEATQENRRGRFKLVSPNQLNLQLRVHYP